MGSARHKAIHNLRYTLASCRQEQRGFSFELEQFCGEGPERKGSKKFSTPVLSLGSPVKAPSPGPKVLAVRRISIGGNHLRPYFSSLATAFPKSSLSESGDSHASFSREVDYNSDDNLMSSVSHVGARS